MSTLRRTQIKRLDKLASLKVREIGKCERCGRVDKPLFCAHIHPRTKYNTRWDLENLLALCWHCHDWAHKEPIEFSELIKERLGQKKYDDLRIRANMSGKEQDLTAIELDLLN